LGDTDRDGSIIKFWNFSMLIAAVWSGWIWLKIGVVASTCECGNEHSVSIKECNFLTG